jgi:type I restriction enzyme, R subunit
MSEAQLSERDVCTKLIAPAVERAGWDIQSQVREEVSLTVGRVMLRGRLVARGTAKRADYVLYLKPNLPLAVIEAKELILDNKVETGRGDQ